MKRKTRKSVMLVPVILTLFVSSITLIPSSFAVAEQTTSIPVTLTVVNTVKNIDVTMPAALPISVTDGKVLTADNVNITNNSAIVGVEVVSISVENAAYEVASYSNFPEKSTAKIAMQINGCSTEGPGLLAISETAFPDIAPQVSLPINYKAKVSVSNDVSGLKVANVVFTLSATE